METPHSMGNRTRREEARYKTLGMYQTKWRMRLSPHHLVSLQTERSAVAFQVVLGYIALPRVGVLFDRQVSIAFNSQCSWT